MRNDDTVDFGSGNGFDDIARANKALHGIVGKRVLYRDSLGA